MARKRKIRQRATSTSSSSSSSNSRRSRSRKKRIRKSKKSRRRSRSSTSTNSTSSYRKRRKRSPRRKYRRSPSTSSTSSSFSESRKKRARKNSKPRSRSRPRSRSFDDLKCRPNRSPMSKSKTGDRSNTGNTSKTGNSSESEYNQKYLAVKSQSKSSANLGFQKFYGYPTMTSAAAAATNHGIESNSSTRYDIPEVGIPEPKVGIVKQEVGTSKPELGGGTCINVKNLSCDIDEKILRWLFSPYGKIKKIKIEKMIGTSEPILVIDFEKEESAQEAIEKLNGTFVSKD